MSRSSSSNQHILDRPLGRGSSRGGVSVGAVSVGGGSSSLSDGSTVSLSAFALLYSELVQYHQSRVASISELERRLESSGYGVGLRVLELLAARSREGKRETRLMSILQFVSGQVWRGLFGRAADSLERSIDHDDEYMIVDHEPVTGSFVSVPADLGQLSVDAYVSGIVAGVLEGSGFPARVTAHSVPMEEGELAPSGGGGQGGKSGGGGGSGHGGGAAWGGLVQRKDKVVFLVKFSRDVLARDAALDR